MRVERLGDAIELVYGKSLPVRSRRKGSVPVYGSNGVVGWHDEPLVGDHTVVVGRKGSAGSVHLTTSPSFPIDTTYFVRPRSGVALDAAYAFYALKHLNLGRLRTETGVPGLNRADAYREPFALPPLDEQRRIVAILNRAARIERLRARAAERMREFVPALFVRMFGDPVSNPMKWRREPFEELCKSTRYGTSKRAARDRTEGLPVIRMGNVTTDGYLDCADLKTVVLADADVENHALRTGDILFNRTNSRELVGKTGIWDGRFSAVAASYFIRFRVDRDKACPIYVWALLNSHGMKRSLFGMARGAIGQANINATEMHALLLPVPPIRLQRRFAEIVQFARSSEVLSRTGHAHASALGISLIDKLLDDGQ